MSPSQHTCFRRLLATGTVVELGLFGLLASIQGSAGPENGWLLILTLLQLPGSALGAGIVAAGWPPEPDRARWIYAFVVLATQMAVIAGVAWLVAEGQPGQPGHPSAKA